MLHKRSENSCSRDTAYLPKKNSNCSIVINVTIVIKFKLDKISNLTVASLTEKKYFIKINSYQNFLFPFYPDIIPNPLNAIKPSNRCHHLTIHYEKKMPKILYSLQNLIKFSRTLKRK